MTPPVAPEPNDQFALYAKAAHLLSRKVLANPNDQQSRDDLAYLASKMRGPTGLAAGANSADVQAAQPQMSTPEAFAVHAFNQIVGMTGADAPERKDVQLRPEGRSADIAAAQQTVDAASQQSPTASLAGDVAGIALSTDAGAGGAITPAARFVASLPKLGRMGLIKMLGGIAREAMSQAKAQPAVAEMAEQTASRVVADASGAEAKALASVKKALFGNRSLTADEQAVVQKVASQVPKPVSVEPVAQGSSPVSHMAAADGAKTEVMARARIFMQDGYPASDALDMARSGTAVPRQRLEIMLGKRFPGTQKWI